MAFWHVLQCGEVPHVDIWEVKVVGVDREVSIIRHLRLKRIWGQRVGGWFLESENKSWKLSQTSDILVSLKMSSEKVIEQFYPRRTAAEQNLRWWSFVINVTIITTWLGNHRGHDYTKPMLAVSRDRETNIGLLCCFLTFILLLFFL